MGFITIPNSIVTGTYVRGGKLNENFLAFTDGLSKGTKDISVGNVQASRIDPSALTVGGDRTVGGAAKGQRIIIPLHKWNASTVFGTQGGVNYRASSVNTTRSLSAAVMSRPGSIVSIRGYIECTAYTAQRTINVEIRKNNSTVSGPAGLDFDITATGIYEDSEEFSRNTYTFVKGDALSFWCTVSASGTATTSGSLVMEVILDS